MDSLLFGLVIGFLLAIIVIVLLRRRKRGGPSITARGSVDTFRSVGELVVLKVFTRQIVTSRDHMLGDWGEKWMAWLLSSKQAAIIFDFVVDFRYDLRHDSFRAETMAEGGVHFTLPPTYYEIQLKGMQIYDEQKSAFVPSVLPKWLGQVFGGNFGPEDKNQLIEAAKAEAEGLSKELVKSMRHEVQKSAEATLGSMARGMGYSELRFSFGDAEPVRLAIDLSSIEASATRALKGVVD
jgi:hypothetical protein